MTSIPRDPLIPINNHFQHRLQIPKLDTGIVAVDPGPGLGIATFHPWPAASRQHFDSMTYSIGRDGHSYLDIILRDLRGYFSGIEFITLIIEKFEFRKDDAEFRDRIDFTAAEYVGISKLVGWREYDSTVMQGAAEAKGFWDATKMRKLGLYAPGQRHANDAMRHLLKYMAFDRNQKWLFTPLKDKS